MIVIKYEMKKCSVSIVLLVTVVLALLSLSPPVFADLYGYKNSKGLIIISATPKQVPQGYRLYKVIKATPKKRIAKPTGLHRVALNKKSPKKSVNNKRKKRKIKTKQKKKRKTKKSLRKKAKSIKTKHSKSLNKKEYCRTLKYEKLIHEEIVINNKTMIMHDDGGQANRLSLVSLKDDDLLSLDENQILKHALGEGEQSVLETQAIVPNGQPFKSYITILTKAVPVEEVICSESPYMMALRPKKSRSSGGLYWGKYNNLIMAASKKHGVDSALIRAVIHTESHFKPRVVSHAGASGLMQLMPFTAKRFGVKDIFDPAQNIDGGTRYLKWLLKHFKNDIRLVAAGYNAGENAVKRYKGVPPYKETRHYVKKVQKLMARYNKNEA